MSVAGLILAAGESRRMGYPKALLTLGGETFLDRLINLFSRFCSPVVAVVGGDAARIEAGLRSSGASVVHNPDYRHGQITSLQCGLRALPPLTEGVLFTLVDHPRVTPATLEALLAAPRPLLRIPRHQGRRGHPIFFAGELIPEFLAVPAASSAREVLTRHAREVEYVDVDDPGILEDIDDPDAYRRLTGEAVP